MGIFGNNDINQSGTTKGTTTGSSLSTLIGNNSPYFKAQPLLNKLLSDASSFYKQGNLDPYVGLSNQTKQGMGGIMAMSQGAMPSLRNALATYSNFAKGGNQVGTGGQQTIYNRSFDDRDIGFEGQQSVYDRSLDPSMSESNLAAVARGDLLSREDPDFERLLASASEKAATAARMAAGAKGRYGGDYAQETVGRTIGDLEAGQRYQRYQDERTRQVEANSLIDAMRQAGLNIGLNAANSRSGIEAGNMDRELAGLGLGLNAANSKTAIEADNRNRQLAGAAGVPGAFQATLDPFREMLKVGQIQEQDTANWKNRYSNNLGALAQLLGVAQPYGTSKNVTTGTTTGTQTGTTSGTTQGPDNTAGELLGLGVGGLSLAKYLKELGGLGGLFGF